jgi:glycosyltransferase involved in cell wall biosynthesis
MVASHPSIAFIDDNYLIWERLSKAKWIDPKVAADIEEYMLNGWYSNSDMYASYLVKRGARATRYVPSRKVVEVTRSRHALGHEVVRLPIGRDGLSATSMASFARQFLREQSRNGIDIVHYGNYYSTFFVPAFLFRLKSRLVAQFSGGEPPSSGGLSGLRWLIGPRFSLKSLDALLLGNTSAEDKRQAGILSDYYRIERGKVRLFPGLCVDEELFRERDREASIRSLGFEQELGHIVSVGYIPKEPVPFLGKNPYLILRLFASLDRTMVNTRKLHFLGFGPGVEDLKLEARRLGVADNTLFHGLVQHHLLPLYYSASELVVNPYPAAHLWTGTVTMEALACGRPVAMFKRAPWAPAELPGGYLLSLDPKGAKSQMESILKNPDAMREKGREAARLPEKFFLRNVGPRLSEIYSEVLAR